MGWAAVSRVISTKTRAVLSLVSGSTEIAILFEVSSRSCNFASETIAGARYTRTVMSVECLIFATILNQGALLFSSEDKSLHAFRAFLDRLICNFIDLLRADSAVAEADAGAIELACGG